MVDTSRTGIIGYSMGGYGVVNVIGGGYSAASATFQNAPPNKLLAERGAASAEYQKSRDPRIKAAIAIGPWGMQGGFWDAEGLEGHSHAGDVRGRKRGRCVGIRERHARDLPGRGECRSLPADVHQRQSQRRRAVSRAGWKAIRRSRSARVLALRRRGVGHRADEQHLPPLRDRVFRRVSERRDRQAGVPRRRAERKGCGVCDGSRRQTHATHTYWKGFKRGTAVGLVLEHAKP